MGTEQIHDAFAKEVLASKENAAFFFRNVLPKKISKSLDFCSIEQENTSYIDETLHSYFSDAVYSCRYSGSVLKIALLFEHKSFVPQFPHFQLLRYILNIWESCRKQRQPIPIVLPIILYHGKRSWIQQPLEEYLSGDTDLLDNFIPGFDYLLIDLSKLQDAEIISLFKNNPAVKLWLLVQKYIYTEEALTQNLDSFFRPDIVYFSLEIGSRFLESIFRYIFEATERNPKTLLQRVPMLPDRAKETIMTTAEKLRKQGILEAARRMLEEGLAEELIIKITGLSRDEVEKLK
jgi:predicted transposase/invertase (TIGR01784 family)